MSSAFINSCQSHNKEWFNHAKKDVLGLPVSARHACLSEASQSIFARPAPVHIHAFFMTQLMDIDPSWCPSEHIRAQTLHALAHHLTSDDVTRKGFEHILTRPAWEENSRKRSHLSDLVDRPELYTWVFHHPNAGPSLLRAELEVFYFLAPSTSNPSWQHPQAKASELSKSDLWQHWIQTAHPKELWRLWYSASEVFRLIDGLGERLFALTCQASPQVQKQLFELFHQHSTSTQDVFHAIPQWSDFMLHQELTNALVHADHEALTRSRKL